MQKSKEILNKKLRKSIALSGERNIMNMVNKNKQFVKLY